MVSGYVYGMAFSSSIFHIAMSNTYYMIREQAGFLIVS